MTIVEGKIAWEKGRVTRMKRQLILEDGTIFIGEAFGSETIQWVKLFLIQV